MAGDKQQREDLVDLGVDAQLLLLRAGAAQQGVSLPVFLNKIQQTAASIGGKTKAARGVGYLRSLPYISAGFTAKEAYDLKTDPNKLSDFRSAHEEMKKEGYGSVIPRTLSIFANPLTTTKAVGEDIGEGLADIYLRNFRPDLLPENYSKTDVPSSVAKATRENALKEIYAQAEQDAARYSPLEDAYKEVMSIKDKPPMFKKPKVELR